MNKLTLIMLGVAISLGIGRADPLPLTMRNVRDYGAKGDGVTDDTLAFRRALGEGRLTSSGERAFVNVRVPSGDYLVSDTIVVWGGTQLFGDWPARPNIRLAPGSPGFQNPQEPKPLFVTALGHALPDNSVDWQTRTNETGGSTNNTFFVTVRDLRIVIDSNNPGAWGFYWLVAQQTALRNVSIDAGDGLGCLRSMWWGGGGVVADIDCEGGEYGWDLTQTSQFVLRSSRFRHQRKAAIRSGETWMLTFWDVSFLDTAPVELTGGSTSLVHCQFHRIRGGLPILRHSGLIHLDDVFSDHDPDRSGACYRSNTITWSSGPSLVLPGHETEFGFQPGRRNPPVYPRVSPDISSARQLGLVGDGSADDTAALRHALDHCSEIFFPAGVYRVSRPIQISNGQRLFGELGSKIVFRAATNETGQNDAAVSISGQVTLNSLIFESHFADAPAVLWNADPTSVVFDCQFLQQGPNRAPAWVFATGGGWIENAWEPGDSERGLVIRSRDPLYLVAVAPEHYRDQAVLIENAANVYLVNLQMEDSRRYLAVRASALVAYGILAGNWNGLGSELVQISGDNLIHLLNLSVSRCPRLVSWKGGSFSEVPGPDPFSRLGRFSTW